MHNKNNENLEKQHFILLTTAYFVLLAIIVSIFIDAVLYYLDIAEIINLFKSMLLAAIIAAISGSLFATILWKTAAEKKVKIFSLGLAMVLCAIPLYAAGLVGILFLSQPGAFQFEEMSTLFHAFLSTLINLYLFIGWWLAIISGFASLYLKEKLVFDVAHSENIERELPVQKQTKMHRSSTPHRKRSV